MTGARLRIGWIDADPTLVGIVIAAVALCAIVFLVNRLRGRRLRGRAGGG